jgi:tetratricopeptide (TPR) repeat protein
MAAAIALVAVAGYVLYSIFGGPTGSVYDKYYEPYTDFTIPPTRGTDPENEQVQKALDYYHEDNYQGVIDVLVDVQRLNVQASMLKGLAYMGLEDYEQAIPWLQIAAESESSFSDSGKYYLALSLVATGDPDAAISWLKLVDPNSFFPVESLLNELE